MKQKGIKCPNCKEEIYSNSRHDFVGCKCGDWFIDGGFDYIRAGGKGMEKTPFQDVIVFREFPPDAPHYFREEQRSRTKFHKWSDIKKQRGSKSKWPHSE